jgi:hypothetical protein
MTISVIRDDRNVKFSAWDACDVCEFVSGDNKYLVVKMPGKISGWNIEVQVERKRKDGSLVWAHVDSHHHYRRYNEARSFVEERVWA